MYSFEPSDEQNMLIAAINRYAVNDLRGAARDADEAAQLSPDLIEKGWELGVLQASIPEEYGGFGDRSAVTGVLASEEMAYGDLSAALAVMAPSLYVMPVLLAGSEEQKQTLIPPVIEAEWKPYTAAIIEPHFDFDFNDLAASAEKVGNAYLISGEKTLVPFADQAEGFLVYARLGDRTQAFVVPSGVEGVTVGERQKLLGVHALPVFSLSFDHVRVPQENLLGGTEGADLSNVWASSQVALAGMAVGMSRAAFDYARDYAKEREAFGVKIAQKQAIAFMLAEMATEIESIRLLVWEAAWMLDNASPDAAKQAYLAMTGAADMAMMVTDRAVQILGGHGYIREHPVEMWMRNGRGFTAFTGLALV